MVSMAVTAALKLASHDMSATIGHDTPITVCLVATRLPFLFLVSSFHFETFKLAISSVSLEHEAVAERLGSTRLALIFNSVAFIVTAGGTMGGGGGDLADAKDHLGDVDERFTFFRAGSSAYVDLAVLRGCNALVIGPSSFGWWAAYLAKVPLGYVVAPRYLYNRSLPRHHPNYPMLKGFRETDYFPTDWRLLENDGMLRPGWG